MSKLKASYKLMLSYEKIIILVYASFCLLPGILSVFFIKKNNIYSLAGSITIMITMEYMFKMGSTYEMYRNFYFSRWTLFKVNLIIILQKALIISTILEFIIIINSILNKDFRLMFMGTILYNKDFSSYIIVFLGLMVALLMIFALTTLVSYLVKPRMIILMILAIINNLSFLFIFDSEQASNVPLMGALLIPIVITIVLFSILWIVLKKKSQFPSSLFSTLKK